VELRLAFSLHMRLVSRCRPIAIPWQCIVCWALVMWSALLMFGSAYRAIRLLHSLVGFDIRRRYWVPICRVCARHTTAMLMDHIPPVPVLFVYYVIQLHDRVVLVLEEFVIEAGATSGRGLRLEVRRIRSGAARDRLGDVAWLDVMAPQSPSSCCHTVTSARTNTRVP
jgi:hypothetical protein